MHTKPQIFKLSDKNVLGRIKFKPPFRISDPLQNEARFVHVVYGNSRLHSPNMRVNLTTGDTILMKCENFVNNWLPNENEELNEVIVLQFYPEILQDIYNNKLPKEFTNKSNLEVHSVEKLQKNPVINNYINSLRYYLDNPELIVDEVVKIKIRELIHILITTDATGKIQTVLSSLFNTQVYEFKEVIHANLFEDISIEELAFLTSLSLSSFKRKFKEVFSSSPAQYIKNKRLEKSKQLLEQTQQRISEIAFDCGFNDLGHFSKSFAAKFELSPSEYRLQYLNQIDN